MFESHQIFLSFLLFLSHLFLSLFFSRRLLNVQNFHESSSARITQDKNFIILIKRFPINLFLCCEYVCKSMSRCRKLDCPTRCGFCKDIQRRNSLKKKIKSKNIIE